MKRLLFFTGYLMGILSTAFAKEYKVATAEQFQQAAGMLKAGDVIIIADGVYSGWAVAINSNGNALAPILIRAATPGKVVFSGEVAATVFTITGKYIQLAGIGFDSCRLIKGNTSPALVELKASENCRITSCVFTKNTVSTQFMPIVVVSGSGHNNEVDHCRFISNINNQELQVKITADAVPLNTLIDYNLFKDKARVNWKVF